MTTQQFHRGDVVQVAQNLGSTMGHFRSGVEAIVEYSYADRYGGQGQNHNSYSLMFTDDGSTSAWYYGNQLTLVRHGTEDDIRAVLAEKEARASQERDLAWIVKHWAEIRLHTPGASAAELMRRVGITNPWGSQGEGMALYANWEQTFHAVDPILTRGAIEELEHIRLAPIDVRIAP